MENGRHYIAATELVSSTTTSRHYLNTKTIKCKSLVLNERR